ncbi:MAG: hypothetical protein LBT87_00990 [Treponema sp.]|jgi:hypothetical protein|nr:hypothetical protein [Treponema sp.]
MASFAYDKLHDFGDAALATDTAFPNVLDLKDTGIERMTVDVRVLTAAAGGTSVAISVQGAPNPSGTFETIVTGRTIALADLKGVYQLPIPPTRHKALKVAITKAGTFTAGVLNAQLNTYIGK